MAGLRHEIEALVSRGDVTAREFITSQPTLAEQEAMVPKMSGGDLVMLMEYALRYRMPILMEYITTELMSRCRQ